MNFINNFLDNIDYFMVLIHFFWEDSVTVLKDFIENHFIKILGNYLDCKA